MAASEVEWLDPAVIGGADFFALADLIADHLTERLAPRIAELLVMGTKPGPATGSSPEADPASFNDDRSGGAAALWTVRQVATHYSVTQSFVYQHADKLGCIRLGGGTCARLRFDPRVVRERWPAVGQPATAPPRPRTRAASRRASRVRHRNYELLDFERER